MTDTTRRNFLTVGAVAAAPFLIKAERKSGATLPILGEGEHTYECIHDWGELPSAIKYGNTHSVCEDTQGHIYIHHTVHASSQSPDSVVVFDDKGKFVRSWGAMFRGGAHGMQYSKEGKDEFFYFCAERHGLVTKRTLKGEEVWTMGYPQDSPPYARPRGNAGPGLPYRPTNLTVGPNGDFWFADGYGSFYMFHYNGKGSYPKLLNTFGGPPKAAPGGAPVISKGPSAPIDSMNNPHGNYVDFRDPAKPILLVADRGNNRIVRYGMDDKPIDVIAGTLAPCHFHEHKGKVVVPDLQGRVTLLDRNNKVICHLGEGRYEGGSGKIRESQDRSAFQPGKFITPHGAIFDHAANIFVVEYLEIGRVTKLRKVS